MKTRRERGREIAVRLTELQRTAGAYAAGRALSPHPDHQAARDEVFRVEALVEAAFAYVGAVEGNERKR